MKMTFTKSQFDVPVGKYMAQFDGVTLKDATGRLDEKGKPMPPAMTWDFTIIEGEHAGKKVDRLTGRMPTPKSACGKMLAAVSDEVLRDGAEIDLGQFYGKTYRITVEEGNGDRTRLSDNPAPVRVYDTSKATPPQPSGPRPRMGTKPPAEPAPHTRWMCWDEGPDGVGDWLPMTAAEFSSYYQTNKVDPATIRVYPDGLDESRAKSATEYGFPALLPY